MYIVQVNIKTFKNNIETYQNMIYSIIDDYYSLEKYLDAGCGPCSLLVSTVTLIYYITRS